MTTHADHTDITPPREHSSGHTASGLGELRWVDPQSLVIGVNTRREVVLDPHFCRDVADRGVREPIVN